MPAVDVVSLVRKLPLNSATVRDSLGDMVDWDAHKENTARLLEVMSYRLELDWVDRITDPEDPEVKLDRARSKRDGRKPPAHPIVPPVALRPRELADERARLYVEEVEAHHVKPAPSARASSRGSFEAAWGIEF